MLRIIGDATGLVFLSALALRTHDKDDSNLCPQFNVLHLHGMNLGRSGRSQTSTRNTLADELEMVVCSRQEHKLPIKELRATEIELHRDSDEERDEWQTHSEWSVDKVHIEFLPYGIRSKTMAERNRSPEYDFPNGMVCRPVFSYSSPEGGGIESDEG
jgi:hypothetical protein